MHKANKMDTIPIRYRFTLADASQCTFDLELGGDKLVAQDEAAGPPPPWSALAFHQCPHCPLTADAFPQCPPAVDLEPIVKSFNTILSHDTVHVEIETAQRRISQRTTAQSALSSLMGLVIASSACPSTAILKPMARFHLPLASEDETIFRAVSTYLLAQYFLHSEGKKADFTLTGLARITQNIHQMNICLTNRLRIACGADAPINAIILLDLYSNSLNYTVQDSLQEIRSLFEPFFKTLSGTR